jgi:hypothetical protein
LGADDLAAIYAGDAAIRVVVIRRRQAKTRARGAVSDVAGQEICRKLESLQNREDAARLLKSQDLSKTDLRRIAKALDVSYQKDDTTDRLTDKIVEATIGFKLRSEAIQGRRQAG